MTPPDSDNAAAGLRFVINTDICAGHGRCYTLDPESFESDDVGYGQLRDRISPCSARAAMEDIAAACPEEAISVEEVPAT